MLIIKLFYFLDYVITSSSPPTRDKLRCEDNLKSRNDWRSERLRDIATALTDRSPDSSLALPSEELLHLKKVNFSYFPDISRVFWETK